ncbi:MAG: hypothetical protein IT428_30495 [Planctomycetaceae bacterium]|nr:hypothetical protein [Planctomycetaceae bacterium]
MNIDDKKIDCIFTFRDGQEHQALAHRFIHQYSDRVQFWYGVAQFGKVAVDLPTEALGGMVKFQDGRSGGVSFIGGRMAEGGYFEVSFVGLGGLNG